MNCMEQGYQWLVNFGFKTEDIHEYRKKVKPGSSVLEYLLRNHKLDETKYLNWAKNHFAMAVLKESFFQQSMKPEILEKYLHHELWNQALLPVMESQGILYIACIEPPNQEVKNYVITNFPSHQFLLAPLSGVEKWWTIINSAKQSLTPENIANTESHHNLNLVPEPPTGIDFSLPQEQSQGQTQTEKPNDEGLSIESPAGLDFSLPQEQPSTQNNKEELTAPTPSIESPAGLDFSLPQNSDEPSAESINQSSSIESPENFDFSLSDENITPQNITAKNIAATDSHHNLNLAPETPTGLNFTVPKETIAQQNSNNEPPVSTNRSTPPPLPSETITTATPIANFHSENTNLTNLQNLDELSNFAFSRFSQLKDKMFLIKQDEVLVPLTWQGQWTSSQNKIDLRHPSVFRIVNNSRSSYHGYVVENPINSHFFNSYYGGKIPEHLTVIPIVHNSEVVAMFLGAGSKQEGEKVDWRNLEKLGDELGPQFFLLQQAA